MMPVHRYTTVRDESFLFLSPSLFFSRLSLCVIPVVKIVCASLALVRFRLAEREREKRRERVREKGRKRQKERATGIGYTNMVPYVHRVPRTRVPAGYTGTQKEKKEKNKITEIQYAYAHTGTVRAYARTVECSIFRVV